MTVTALRGRLSDVPPATLYRHVRTLADAGLLEVVDERPVRGGVERTCRRSPEGGLISREQFTGLPVEDRRTAFAGFVADLARRVDPLLAAPDPPVSFRSDTFDATDEELHALGALLHDAVAALQSVPVPAGQVRTRRSLAAVWASEGADEGGRPGADREQKSSHRPGRDATSAAGQPLGAASIRSDLTMR